MAEGLLQIITNSAILFSFGLDLNILGIDGALKKNNNNNKRKTSQISNKLLHSL